MSATLAIISAGACASVQDAGRFGYRRLGVPCSGALDRASMRIANRLAGNDENHPVVECFDGGQRFGAIDAPLRLAVAGDTELEIANGTGRHRVPAWRSFVLGPGETLRIVRIAPARIAMVAVAGLAVAQVMGSASTYARAAFGGWQGRALCGGDRVPAQAAQGAAERVLPTPLQPRHDAIRVVMGPQDDHFDEDGLSGFLAAEFRVSPAADRMGIRLDGPRIPLRRGRTHEIVSDATVPGAIQVPGSGQPIVLLADAQTIGGYPKIATVISTDLARLAGKRPGDVLRFTTVDAAQGEAIARAHAQQVRTLLASIRADSRGIDLDALASANLVYGVVDALADDPPTIEGVRDEEDRQWK